MDAIILPPLRFVYTAIIIVITHYAGGLRQKVRKRDWELSLSVFRLFFCPKEPDEFICFCTFREANNNLMTRYKNETAYFKHHKRRLANSGFNTIMRDYSISFKCFEERVMVSKKFSFQLQLCTSVGDLMSVAFHSVTKGTV